jgi:hypothetical protein
MRRAWVRFPQAIQWNEHRLFLFLSQQLEQDPNQGQGSYLNTYRPQMGHHQLAVVLQIHLHLQRNQRKQYLQWQ